VRLRAKKLGLRVRVSADSKGGTLTIQAYKPDDSAAEAKAEEDALKNGEVVAIEPIKRSKKRKK
jgi:hypothetical protein